MCRENKNRLVQKKATAKAQSTISVKQTVMSHTGNPSNSSSTLYSKILTFSDPEKDIFGNIVEKGENADISIFSFSHNVFHPIKDKIYPLTLALLMTTLEAFVKSVDQDQTAHSMYF